MAIVVGVTAEYLLRLSGVANLGGTVGGAVGIIAAMILIKKKEKKNEVSSKKSKNR